MKKNTRRAWWQKLYVVPRSPKYWFLDLLRKSLADSCVELLLLLLAVELRHQHIAQRLSSIYSVSAFQTELNSEFPKKNQDEMAHNFFLFSRKPVLQTRTIKFLLSWAHFCSLTQTQQPMTNTVVKWPKASTLLLRCQQQGQQVSVTCQ